MRLLFNIKNPDSFFQLIGWNFQIIYQRNPRLKTILPCKMDKKRQPFGLSKKNGNVLKWLRKFGVKKTKIRSRKK